MKIDKFTLNKKEYPGGAIPGMEERSQERILVIPEQHQANRLFYTIDGQKVYLEIQGHEAVHLPPHTAPYFFEKHQEVWEIGLPSKIISRDIDETFTASPFFLTGDACFYSFLFRRIMVQGKMEFSPGKHQVVLWLVKGSMEIQMGNQVQKMEINQPLRLQSHGEIMEFQGNGEVFLFKI